jgi:hypothetical protein
VKWRDNPNSNNNDFKGNVDISRVGGDTKLFDALYYKDVRLLVVYSLNNSEQDVLIIKVKLSYYKGHNKHLKLQVD